MLIQIIWFFTLPVIMFVTYKLVWIALKKYEKKAGN
jgi:hypothetical protein